jgi:uroporphyrinogen decarboxylase
MSKPLLDVLCGATRMPPPIWLMRQAGRYLPEYRAARKRAGGFLAMCLDPALAGEITLQPVRRFGLDAAILFSDILIVPWAMGQDLAFQEGSGPQLSPIRDARGLATLDPARVLERARPVFRTVSRVAQELPAEVALIGFAGAPWTVAAYMTEGSGGNGFPTALAMAESGNPILDGIVERLVAATVDYLLAQIVAGAETVQLFDSWAGLLAERLRERWSIAPLARIVARLREETPDVPVILFPRGVGRDAERYRALVRPDAIGLDQDADLLWARDTLQPHCALQGNLDPAVLVAGGPALAQAVDTIMRSLGGGRFVFNLGHGVVPETPPEHVAQLVELVRDWRPQ